MIIHLDTHDDTPLNTHNQEDYNTLVNLISQAQDTSDKDCLDKIRSSIEDAPILNKNDLKLYQRIQGQCPIKALQDYTYFKPNFQKISKHFTFLKTGNNPGHFIKLPDRSNKEDILYTLITTLVYESKRHPWNQTPCTTLRQVIAKLDSEQYNRDTTRDEFEEAKECIETATKNYYGEYLSDDSDSDEEKDYDESHLKKAHTLLSRIKKDTQKYKAHVQKLLNKNAYQVRVFLKRPKTFPQAPANHPLVCLYYSSSKDKNSKNNTKNPTNWYYVIGQPNQPPKGKGIKVSKAVNQWLNTKNQNTLQNLDAILHKRSTYPPFQITHTDCHALLTLLARDTSLNNKVKGDEKIQPSIQLLSTIHHPKLGDTVESDLEQLNTIVAKKNGKSLKTLKTLFVVAQYRGIHYNQNQWNANGRRQHREFDEIGKALYSKSVIMHSGFSSFNDFLKALMGNKNVKNIYPLLQKKAKTLASQLLMLRASKPIIYQGSHYLNILELLQELYTADYKRFHALLKQIVEGNHDTIRFLENSVFNQHNPFLSTGDTPHHALKYAYGLKTYGGKNKKEKQANERAQLKPRWRADGKAERPYVGKVYVSLHPITDYIGHNKPNHIPTLFNQGHIGIANVIVQEKETAFLGYLPARRLTLQHKAKYPSFKKHYKRLYAYKYGIDETFFYQIRQGLLQYAPHTDERKRLEEWIGQYLCAYQEVRLIEEARTIAEKNGQILVYQNAQGQFELTPPQAIPASKNKSAWNIIKQNKEKIKQLVKKSLTQAKNNLQHKKNYHFFGSPTNLKTDKYLKIPTHYPTPRPTQTLELQEEKPPPNVHIKHASQQTIKNQSNTFIKAKYKKC